jgi:hypothetical protein
MTLLLYIAENLPSYLVISIVLTLSLAAMIRGQWWGFLIIVLFSMSIVGNFIGETFTDEQGIWYALSAVTAMLICWLTRPAKKNLKHIEAASHGEIE